MVSFILTAVFAFFAYLLLTAGSWNPAEIVTGLVLSLITAAISARFFGESYKRRLNPLRLVTTVFYVVGPFFIEMALANVGVAIAVITGKIRPGVVKYRSGLETDLGITLLANSITLTPGTLTVDIDEDNNDLYVHLINVAEGDEEKDVLEGKAIFSTFNLTPWIRRMAE
jgi:multicomponent Na+:H+ antiporter subunit E